jgi:hypothetical protein
VFGGATLRATSRLDISTQVHTVPGEVTTFRLAADWRLR